MDMRDGGGRLRLRRLPSALQSRARWARFDALAGLALLGASGCGGAKPAGECKETDLVLLEVVPSVVLNQGEDGASRSVVLHVYQLAEGDLLTRATYEEMWGESPGATLGGARLSGPDEALLVPGQRLTLRLKRHPEAPYLAVVAKYRRADGSWRLLAELPPAIDPCGPGRRPPPRVRVQARRFDLRLSSGDAH